MLSNNSGHEVCRINIQLSSSQIGDLNVRDVSTSHICRWATMSTPKGDHARSGKFSESHRHEF